MGTKNLLIFKIKFAYDYFLAQGHNWLLSDKTLLAVWLIVSLGITMWSQLRLLIPLYLLTLASCSQLIGDECVSTTQCAAGQFCDLSSKDGYCTMSPCDATSCS